MKWTPSRSIVLSRICVGLCALVYLAVVIGCPFAVEGYIAISASQAEGNEMWFMISVYLCAVPVGVILWKLGRLIKNIGDLNLFTGENISCLRWISWMCFAVAAIALVSAAYYIFWAIIGCCMAFMGLLIRVIKNVFERARETKEENDFTI